MCKQCRKCQEIKELSEFPNDKSKKDGHYSYCKTCVKIINKSNSDKNRNYFKDYNSKRKDKHKEYMKKYYRDNLDTLKEQNKEYYNKNIDAIRKMHSDYMKTPMGKIASANNRIKRRSSSKKGDATSKQIGELLSSTTHCYWCKNKLHGKNIHIDHYIPFSKGGEHTLSNLVVSCSTCNLNKHAKDPIEFANSLGRLL